METFLIVTQTVISAFFILSVLFQEKGSAMSLTFGGGDHGDTFYGSKQGIDKLLNWSSYIFGSLFVINAIVYLVITKI